MAATTDSPKELIDHVTSLIVNRCSDEDLLGKMDILERPEDNREPLATFLAGVYMGSTAVAREWFRDSPKTFMAYYARDCEPAPKANEARAEFPALHVTYEDGGTLPKAFAAMRVVTDDQAIAVVSPRLTQDEQRIARAVAAYAALANSAPVVLVGVENLLEAIAEASGPTEPYPKSA